MPTVDAVDELVETFPYGTRPGTAPHVGSIDGAGVAHRPGEQVDLHGQLAGRQVERVRVADEIVGLPLGGLEEFERIGHNREIQENNQKGKGAVLAPGGW